jgi:hypothetical protein
VELDYTHYDGDMHYLGHPTLRDPITACGTVPYPTNSGSLLLPESSTTYDWDANNTLVFPANVTHVDSSLGHTTGIHSYHANGTIGGSLKHMATHGQQERSSAQTDMIATSESQSELPENSEARFQKTLRGTFTCAQCTEVFSDLVELSSHAWTTNHLAFGCEQDGCEKTFSRLDSCRRHQRKHRDDAKCFPCKYCKKYRGSNGFKRKDHLTQHIRNYHHIGEDDALSDVPWGRRWCSKIGCSHHRDSSERFAKRSVFSTSAEYTKHMRTVHNESEYPCPQPGCNRVNGNGYFRESDLRNHLRKVHGTDGALEGDD